MIPNLIANPQKQDKMSPYIYVLAVNGALFFFSILFYLFPPKKINSIYGYRTHKSMLNQDIWEYSNKIFTNWLLRYSGISFLFALFLVYLNPNKEQTWIPMALVLLSLLVTIIKTEQGIKANFDEDGKRK